MLPYSPWLRGVDFNHWSPGYEPGGITWLSYLASQGEDGACGSIPVWVRPVRLPFHHIIYYSPHGQGEMEQNGFEPSSWRKRLWGESIRLIFLASQDCSACAICMRVRVREFTLYSFTPLLSLLYTILLYLSCMLYSIWIFYPPILKLNPLLNREQTWSITTLSALYGCSQDT